MRCHARRTVVVLGILAVIILFGASVQAADVVQATTGKISEWFGKEGNARMGGDIRIREVYFSNLPIIADPPGVTRRGDNHFFRFRTRLYAEGDPSENTALKARITNEFRYYDKPDTESWDFPDEWVIDSLYFDVKDMFDGKLSLRIGRQDMIYGTGKLILEGTPKDGSRTIYFDAIKATLKPMEGTSIDFLGIYNQAENDLAINSQDRDLTGYDPAFNDATESGFGAYGKYGGVEGVPMEGYYLYKRESSWTSRSTNTVPRAYVNTIGLRASPKTGDAYDGNVEAAYQFGKTGEEDQSAFMIDAIANWHLPTMEQYKPCLGLGWYYLSGDDPNSTKDEGWNPLWARYPQYSELYVYSWDAERAGRWTNVNMPHLDFTMVPAEYWKVAAMLAYMGANEDDGPGTGKERGWLFTLWNKFNIKKGLLGTKDNLSAHLLAEFLEPGDYYNVTKTAYFLRWQLMYSF